MRELAHQPLERHTSSQQPKIVILVYEVFIHQQADDAFTFAYIALYIVLQHGEASQLSFVIRVELVLGFKGRQRGQKNIFLF